MKLNRYNPYANAGAGSGEEEADEDDEGEESEDDFQARPLSRISHAPLAVRSDIASELSLLSYHARKRLVARGP